MNTKKTFGTILTILGIVALIYTCVFFANSPNLQADIRPLVVYGILGLIFFFAGISLIRTTKDQDEVEINP
jgi:uncharacterized membrane protein